jgi:hypothetical protein
MLVYLSLFNDLKPVVDYKSRLKYVFHIDCGKLYVLCINQLIKWPFRDGTQRHSFRESTAPRSLNRSFFLIIWSTEIFTR